MTGRAVVTTRLSREAMKRAMPVMTTAQIARDLVRRRSPSRSSATERWELSVMGAAALTDGTFGPGAAVGSEAGSAVASSLTRFERVRSL